MKKTIIICLFASLLLFVGCNDKLDVQQMYGFTVSTMPVQTAIKLGETVEIRCQLNRSGKYKGAKYYIDYFQSEGLMIFMNLMTKHFDFIILRIVKINRLLTLLFMIISIRNVN